MAREITHTHYDGSVTTGTHYRCVGDIRGWCGTQHRELTAALRCLKSDRAGCESQGGYSDRAIYLYDDDGRQGLAEYDHLL